MTIHSRTPIFNNNALKVPLNAIFGMFILLSQTNISESQNLTASYYSTESLKKDGQWYKTWGVMANGRQFSDTEFTCASWDYPLGTKVKITNRTTGTSVVCTVTDRTNKRFKGERIDLSPVAFSRISPLEQGIVPCEVRRI